MSPPPSSSTESPLAMNMQTTTSAFLQTWTGNWIDNLQTNLSLRAPECSHTILPSSLGRNNESNEVWAAKYSKAAPLITNGKMTMNDYLAVPEERRAVARSSLEADTPVGKYRNEYVWFLDFDEEGGKIVKIVEFLDGSAAGELLERLRGGGLFEGWGH